MEGNKDESERCMAIAEQSLSKKEFDKAVKFAQKADQLYSTEVTKSKRKKNENHNRKSNSVFCMIFKISFFQFKDC